MVGFFKISSTLESISIIHPRCIKEVFSDATVFIANFGLFLHHIGSDSNLYSGVLFYQENLVDIALRHSCPPPHQKENSFGESNKEYGDIKIQLV